MNAQHTTTNVADRNGLSRNKKTDVTRTDVVPSGDPLRIDILTLQQSIVDETRSPWRRDFGNCGMRKSMTLFFAFHFEQQAVPPTFTGTTPLFTWKKGKNSGCSMILPQKVFQSPVVGDLPCTAVPLETLIPRTCLQGGAGKCTKIE